MYKQRVEELERKKDQDEDDSTKADNEWIDMDHVKSGGMFGQLRKKHRQTLLDLSISLISIYLTTSFVQSI